MEKDFLEALPKAHFLPDLPRPMLGQRLLACRYLKTARGVPVEVDRPIDRLDAQAVIQEQVGRLDRGYLNRWARVLGVVERLRAALPARRG